MITHCIKPCLIVSRPPFADGRLSLPSVAVQGNRKSTPYHAMAARQACTLRLHLTHHWRFPVMLALRVPLRSVCSTGTGKTLIARQIGKMLNGKEPKIVNGPEASSGPGWAWLRLRP